MISLPVVDRWMGGTSCNGLGEVAPLGRTTLFAWCSKAPERGHPCFLEHGGLQMSGRTTRIPEPLSIPSRDPELIERIVPLSQVESGRTSSERYIRSETVLSVASITMGVTEP